jgi:hypothetical protein
MSVESETGWGSKLVWRGRRGEKSLDHARNRTTFRRLSTPYSGLYIDHAVRILYICIYLRKFCEVMTENSAIRRYTQSVANYLFIILLLR